MVYQTDSTIEEVRKWGCLFVILGSPAEKISGKTITVEILDQAYEKALNNGYIRKDCYVLDYVGIINAYGEILGVEMDVQYLYKFKNGKKIFNTHPDAFISRPNFFTTYFVIDTDNDHQLDDEGNGHFIETTGSGYIVFDPYPNSRAAKYGQIHSSRCFYVGGRRGKDNSND
jgi:hypothetical protein